jgi:signal transduction histidine kinase
MADGERQRSSLVNLLPSDIAMANARMIRLRWLAGCAVLLATALGVHLLHLPLPETPLYLLGVLILTYNGILLAVARRIPSPRSDHALRLSRQSVILQVGLDWSTMAIFLHLTGGITSPAIPFFLIHMLMVTILLPGVAWYVFVSIATGILALLALLEADGILPNYAVLPALPPGLHADPLFILAQILFFASAASATLLLTASIMTRLRERERQVMALLQSSQAVSSTLSLDEVLQRLCEQAAEAAFTDRASIRLLDQTGETLELVAAHGLREEYQRKGPVELSRSGLDREVLSRGPVLIDETATDERIQYPREVLEEGIHSILAVPIIGRKGPLGVLRVYSTRVKRFTPDDAGFLTAIAGEGAIAIENAMAHHSLQQADQDRAQFVRTVTHELRSPVSGAQSLVRVLLGGMGGELDERQQDVIGRVSARLDRLMDLINDLLVLAATKSVSLQEQAQAVNLIPIIQRVLDQHSLAAEEKSIGLVRDIPPEVLVVKATSEGLSQIFGNLVDNALKYTPRGGSVKITARQRQGSAVVSVSDTGMGIPKEEVPRLWEEFYRATNVRRAEITGTGLGLSIVQRLVQSFGGYIGVHSIEGKGTTFIVTLPMPAPTD